MVRCIDCGTLVTESSSLESNRHVEAVMQVEENAKVKQEDFGLRRSRCDTRLPEMQPYGQFQEETLQTPEALL